MYFNLLSEIVKSILIHDSLHAIAAATLSLLSRATCSMRPINHLVHSYHGIFKTLSAALVAFDSFAFVINASREGISARFRMQGHVPESSLSTAAADSLFALPGKVTGQERGF